MRSSGASAETSRANAGFAMSTSSIRRFYLIGRVVRGDGERARPVRAVAPGVVGASLHDAVARFQVHFSGIERECNLAFEHDAKIERPRLLHGGVRRARLI